MEVSQKELEALVAAVVKNLNSTQKTPPPAKLLTRTAADIDKWGVFRELDDAVAAAGEARKALSSLAARAEYVEAIRKAGREHARALAELAVKETGFGRVDHKTTKNLFMTDKTPGPEYLSPEVYTGDHGLTLVEQAPWGVIASVTPSTNPAATVINNAISMISAGNGVVFAPHPKAKAVSQEAIRILNRAVADCGGPSCLLTTVAEPTIDSAERLFSHPGANLLVVTGGEAVVHAARKATDKRLVAAGAGNPPVVVDETADIPRAARSIVFGASFDNNIICADEKVAVSVDSITDRLIREMISCGAVLLTPQQVRQMEDLILETSKDGSKVINRKWVGKDAALFADAIGLKVDAATPLLICETSADHPFAVTELMMPVLPLVRARDVDEAIDLAVMLEQGLHHTAGMHSRNLDALTRMAREIDTTLFIKNGPHLAGIGYGSEGPTTMTISTPTGEGVTTCRTFVRRRHCVVVDHLRIT